MLSRARARESDTPECSPTLPSASRRDLRRHVCQFDSTASSTLPRLRGLRACVRVRGRALALVSSLFACLPCPPCLPRARAGASRARTHVLRDARRQAAVGHLLPRRGDLRVDEHGTGADQGRPEHLSAAQDAGTGGGAQGDKNAHARSQGDADAIMHRTQARSPQTRTATRRKLPPQYLQQRSPTR